jgi:DNA-binding response OmpR family regulator
VAGLRNVLIVEDDVMIRDLYRLALVEADYTVEVAGNVSEVYLKLATFHPDCILLDIMLPGTSGLEILQELRNNPAHGCTQAKIIMITNLAQRTTIDNALQAGAEGYIIKADILPKDLPKVISSLEEE